MGFNFEKYVKSGRSSQIANEAVAVAVLAAKANGLRVEGYAVAPKSLVYVCGQLLTDGDQSNRDHIPPSACIAQRDKAQSPLILPTHKACNASFMVADELEALTADKAAAEGKGGQLTADLAMAKEDAMRERQAGEAARTVLTKATLNRQ